MAASASDKARKTYSYLQKTLNAGIDASVNVLTPNNVTNIPTDTGVSFVVDRVDSAGNKTPALRELMTGYVSGGTIAGLVRGEQGTTAQAHLANAVIEFVNSGEMWNDLIDFLLQDHSNPNGNHKTLTDDNGNEWLERSSVASAVNQVKVTNAIANGSPRLDASGDDSIIDLLLGGKGGGVAHVENTELIGDFVVPGTGAVALSSGLIGTFANITYYIAGKRYKKSSIPNKTYTASKDTYVDIDTSGNVTYVEVANGATVGMTLTANSVRVAKVVTNGSAITSVTQKGFDPLENPIAAPQPVKVTQTSSYLKIGSLMIAWGTTTTPSIGTAAGTEVSGSFNFPVAFSSAPVAMCNPSDLGNACAEYAFINSTSTTGAGYWAGHAIASGGASSMTLRWMAIGPA